jgi:hypothetical protein
MRTSQKYLQASSHENRSVENTDFGLLSPCEALHMTLGVGPPKVEVRDTAAAAIIHLSDIADARGAKRTYKRAGNV